MLNSLLVFRNLLIFLRMLTPFEGYLLDRCPIIKTPHLFKVAACQSFDVAAVAAV